jgi:hypothetical protein
MFKMVLLYSLMISTILFHRVSSFLEVTLAVVDRLWVKTTWNQQRRNYGSHPERGLYLQMDAKYFSVLIKPPEIKSKFFLKTSRDRIHRTSWNTLFTDYATRSGKRQHRRLWI